MTCDEFLQEMFLAQERCAANHEQPCGSDECALCIYRKAKP